MDCVKTGKLLQTLRREKQMTQRQLAQALNVSDKAVSKWERGLGCPDVSLLGGLSRALGVNLEEMLAGDMDPNQRSNGNLKKVRFYRCPLCGNVMLCTDEASIACCGRRMEALVPQQADPAHALTVEPVEDELYITSDHPMTKGHALVFIAYVTGDRLFFVRLYPEQDAQTRCKRLGPGILYACCLEHGLFSQRIR